MRHGHEISPAWHGAPWDERREFDWEAPEPAAPIRPWQAIGLAVVLGVMPDVSVAHGLARQDRTRLDALMSGVAAQ